MLQFSNTSPLAFTYTASLTYGPVTFTMSLGAVDAPQNYPPTGYHINNDEFQITVMNSYIFVVCDPPSGSSIRYLVQPTCFMTPTCLPAQSQVGVVVTLTTSPPNVGTLNLNNN